MAEPKMASSTAQGAACNTPFRKRSHVLQFLGVVVGAVSMFGAEKLWVLLVLVLTFSADGPYQ
jgi:hypothetical protein